MPGTVLLEDAQKYFQDRLSQHAQDGWNALQQAVQPVQQAVQALPQIDPNEVTQRLQQHAQDTWAAAQQQAQAAQDAAQEAARQAEEQARQQAEAAQQQLDQARQLAQQQAQAVQQQAASFTAPDTAGVQQALAQRTPLDHLDAAVQGARQTAQNLADSPVGQFASGASDVLEQRRQQSIQSQADLGNQIIGGDLGGAAQSALQQVGSSSPLGSEQGDLSGPVSAGLTAAGVDPNVSRVLGAVSNLLVPVGGEARAAGAAERALPRAAEDVAPEAISRVQRFLSGTPIADVHLPAPVQDFLTGTSSEAGSIPARAGARLGGAVAGGLAGNATTPDDADPFSRGAHIVGGAAAGAAAPGLVLSALRDARPTQAELDALRVATRPTVTGQGATEAFVRNRLLGQTPTTGDVGTLAQDVVSFGKGNLLSGAATHLSNIATQLYELAQQPIGRAVTGGESDAVAGLRSAGLSVPEALGRFKDTLASGVSFYADPERGVTRTYNPFLRLLSATDDMFRTVGEGMGRGMEAQRILTENGRPTDAGTISSLVQSNANRILSAGDTASHTSVFGGGASTGIGRALSDVKNRLLSSPNTGQQAMGMLVDALVPFSVVPDRLWTLGVLRAPGVSEANTVRKLLRIGPGAPTNAAEMRDVLGTGLVNSVVNMAVLSQVANGNVTGPDDPEHPSSVRINGTWVDYSNWGPLAAQFSIPAAIAESVRKTGTLPDQSVLSYANAATNATAKAILQQGYLDNMISLLGSIGQGNTTSAVSRTATQYLDRVVPGSAMLNSIEQAFDQNMRDVNAANPWERQMSRIPGLAGMLPQRISPTTGEPALRGRQGLSGVLFRAETQPPDPLRQEADRLHALGYDTAPPTTYPDKITIAGSEIRLSPDEQRAVTEITGQRLAGLAVRLDSPGYANLPHTRAGEDRRALQVRAWLNAAEQVRTSAAVRVLGSAEVRSRILSGPKVAGRLVHQAAPPSIEIPMPNIDPNEALAPLYLLESYRRRAEEEAQRRRDQEDQFRATQQSDQRGLING